MTFNDFNVKSGGHQQDSGDGRHDKTLIGRPPHNHWIYRKNPAIFDLTRPAAPEFPIPNPHESITITTNTTPVIISPSKTALVVIDMQNFFLSPALGRQAEGPGYRAEQQLLEYALPAAIASKIQVIWLTWGLTEDDVCSMPVSILRNFEHESLNPDAENPNVTNEFGEPRRLYVGLGNDLGPVKLDDGTIVDAGKMLMRDSWNTDLIPHLKEAYQVGLRTKPPNVLIVKNRMSGLWGASTPCTEFLEEHGIRTLLFAGVNTNHCVSGSIQDAYVKGFDCIMLKDACGTTSPEYTAKAVEYSLNKSLGFVTDCKAFKRGVDKMLSG